MKQNKRDSFIESITNTLIGFVLTIIFSPLVYFTCGVKISNIKIGFTTILFTIISILRNYFIRRYFNKSEILTFTEVLNRYCEGTNFEINFKNYLKNNYYFIKK